MEQKKRVKFVTITPQAEEIMIYCARVSSPRQDNPEYAGLLKYCLKHEHWSVFETPHMTLEVTTSRAISAQILRHRSCKFQEFSQRYAEAQGYISYEARRQDAGNRQNSTDDLPEDVKQEFLDAQAYIWDEAYGWYQNLLKKGVAKECARMILPLNTKTRVYVTGDVRSWIHYINARTKQGSQLEHKAIAEECRDIFKQELPVTAEALGW